MVNNRVFQTHANLLAIEIQIPKSSTNPQLLFFPEKVPLLYTLSPPNVPCAAVLCAAPLFLLSSPVCVAASVGYNRECVLCGHVV